MSRIRVISELGFTLCFTTCVGAFAAPKVPVDNLKLMYARRRLPVEH